ncbi:pyridoxal 5'-phosphate synthase glutaminase subunit PdxT [Sediminivirga luteola]|uniref:pyridoxal 5'-phosphate synthase glutaminase subunit PdxT n=1 Tax=Sediminivirga luteola TaxID=1774748 RepID=UPI00166C01B3
MSGRRATGPAAASESPGPPGSGAPARPRIGVLALQGAVAEHRDMLVRLGADTVAVRRPEQLEELDGLVVPGGESTAIARLAAPMGLLPAVRARLDAGMAVFGTCAGLILLSDRIADAEALAGFDRIGGLDVTTRRNGYGRQLESFEATLEIGPDREPPRPVAFIRAPVIEDTTSGVEVLAWYGGHPVAVRQGRILAASFHPEITGDDRLHRRFLQMAASAAAARAEGAPVRLAVARGAPGPKSPLSGSSLR